MFRSILVMIMLISLFIQPLWAQNPKPSVAEQVNKVNVFNRITDYWATLEKNDIERATIIKQRREERRLKRLQALQLKKNQEQQRKAQQMTEDMKRLKGL